MSIWLMLLVALADPPLDDRLLAAQQLVVAHPEVVDGHVRLAGILQEKGAHVQALEVLADAAQRADDPRVHRMTGRSLGVLGRNSEALAALDRALRFGPEILALWYRGLVRNRLGLQAEAVADLQAATALGHPIDLHLDLARLQAAAGATEAHVAGLREGVAATGSSVLREALARAELARGNAAGALVEADALVAEAAVDTRWELLRAEALAALGRPDEARVARDRALAEAHRLVAVRPSCLALRDRAQVHEVRGERAEAGVDRALAAVRCPSPPGPEAFAGQVR